MPDQHHPVAILTGAGSGIGRAAARILSSRGWRLALAGRREGPLEETAATLSGEYAVIPTDITDPAQVGRLVEVTLARFGRIDAIVNNAGAAPLVPIPDITPDHVEHVLAVNLSGPMQVVNAAWPHLLAREGEGPARIVNISSMATVDPFPGLAAYAAAKSGLESLTRSIRNEAPAEKILAFAIAPGAVETPMLRAIASTENLPPERTLAPEAVAEVVADVLAGRRDEENGGTIHLPSP